MKHLKYALGLQTLAQGWEGTYNLIGGLLNNKIIVLYLNKLFVFVEK